MYFIKDKIANHAIMNLQQFERMEYPVAEQMAQKL